MLHHRTLKPVILQDWSEHRELFESSLSATKTVSQPRSERSGMCASEPIPHWLNYIRLHRETGDYLDNATEPVPWPQRNEPRRDLNPRPWSVRERRHFQPAPADDTDRAKNPGPARRM